MDILTAWIAGDIAGGGRNAGAEEGHHAASMARSDAAHRVKMAEIGAEQKVERVFVYASNQRMKLSAFRKAADNLIDELQRANINHPLASKDALLSMAKAELDREFAKDDEEINEETIVAIEQYHKPDTTTKE